VGEVAILARDAGQVRELALSHPDRRNALNEPLLALLTAALDQAVRDGVRAVVLRGQGDLAFSAGYDLSALGPTSASGGLPDAGLEAALDHLEALPIPVIALVNGPAFGGGLELAARCDLRIAFEGVKLGMPPARLGIVYGPRGLGRFLALMGPSQARKLFFTGEPVTAEEARAVGLVDEVLPRDEAEARAHALAAQMAQNAPLAVSGMRTLLLQLERSMLAGVDLAQSTALRARAFQSDDAREGRQAFLERRGPTFTGK
jgi:enoyl-CoA hydratase/carnithine racemase